MLGIAALTPTYLTALPPLLAGEGWGGVALSLKVKSHPLPTSPCKQGEEQIKSASSSRPYRTCHREILDSRSGYVE